MLTGLLKIFIKEIGLKKRKEETVQHREMKTRKSKKNLALRSSSQKLLALSY